MGKLRMRLWLIVALVSFAHSVWAKPAPKLDRRTEDKLITAMIRMTQVLSGSSDANITAVETGTRALARQLAAARREDIPLTPWDFERPLPPPEQNTAPVYEELKRLLDQEPLDADLQESALRMGSRFIFGPDDVAAARKLLSERQDVMALVRQATDRPACVFHREWALGPSMTFPELSPARTAARLLRIESYLLALDGHYGEAVASQARGLRIAGQIASDGVLIHYLVGIACEAIALAGMEDILYRAGPNPQVAEQIRTAIASYRPVYSLRRTLEGETLMVMATMDQFRRLGFRSIYAITGKDWSEDAETRQAVAFWDRSSKLQEVWLSWIDAGEADILARMRHALAISDRPYLVRRRLAQQWGADLKSRSQGMVSLFRVVLLPGIAPAIAKEGGVRARERVLMGGAAILAYKARQGRWPDRLEQADPRLPPDPFTERTLKYRREGDGFVIYSVGENGHYDGGKLGAPLERIQAVFRYPPPAPQTPPAATELPAPPPRK